MERAFADQDRRLSNYAGSIAEIPAAPLGACLGTVHARDSTVAMQTLIDPFELSGPLSVAPPPARTAPAYDGRKTLVDLDIEWEVPTATAPAHPVVRGTRFWSSDDDR